MQLFCAKDKHITKKINPIFYKERREHVIIFIMEITKLE